MQILFGGGYDSDLECSVAYGYSSGFGRWRAVGRRAPWMWTASLLFSAALGVAAHHVGFQVEGGGSGGRVDAALIGVRWDRAVHPPARPDPKIDKTDGSDQPFGSDSGWFCRIFDLVGRASGAPYNFSGDPTRPKSDV